MIWWHDVSHWITAKTLFYGQDFRIFVSHFVFIHSKSENFNLKIACYELLREKNQNTNKIFVNIISYSQPVFGSRHVIDSLVHGPQSFLPFSLQLLYWPLCTVNFTLYKLARHEHFLISKSTYSHVNIFISHKVFDENYQSKLTDFKLNSDFSYNFHL